ncbi:MAG: hypothetical protein J6S71_02040 [Clostridia bacterium]|nr:hypothetical protein [Clostridia bacterium]
MDKMKCLRCGEEMHYLSREKLQLGKTGWVLGDLPNLLSGALDVEIFVCSKCRKIEFFVVEGAIQEDELPKMTCPECGAVHDFDYPKCPKCNHEYF